MYLPPTKNRRPANRRCNAPTQPLGPPGPLNIGGNSALGGFPEALGQPGMIESWASRVVLSIDDYELAANRTDLVIPEAIRFADPMGRDVGDINGMPEIAVQKTARTLIVLESALGESVGTKKQTTATTQSELSRPEAILPPDE